MNKQLTNADQLRDSGKFQEAIKEYKESLEKLELSTQGVIYQNIGLCYSALKIKDRALENFVKAEEIYRQNLDDLAIMNVYRDIAMTYSNIDNYDQCEDWLNKALEIGKKVKDKRNPKYQADLGITLSRLGTVYSEAGDYIKAKKYYKKADKILAMSANSYYRVTNLVTWMMDCHKMGSYKELVHLNRLIHVVMNDSSSKFDFKLDLKVALTDAYIAKRTKNEIEYKKAKSKVESILKKLDSNVKKIVTERFHIEDFI